MTGVIEVAAPRRYTGAAMDAATLPTTLLVVGNPNVGKSVVFQWLTGRYSTVSNYPGTTVTVSRGQAMLDGHPVAVRDTPGINSLMANSEEELVSRRLVLGPGRPVILQVADAKALERALALTLELAEADAPVVLELNMMDEARERRLAIDTRKLAQRLRVPVVETVATQRQGLDRLRRALPSAAVPAERVTYPPDIERAAQHLAEALPADAPGRRVWALLWLGCDPEAAQRFARLPDPEAVRSLTAVVDAAQRQ